MFPGSSAVEQATVNRLAGGSNPSRGATFPRNRLLFPVVIRQAISKASHRLTYVYDLCLVLANITSFRTKNCDCVFGFNKT